MDVPMCFSPLISFLPYSLCSQHGCTGVSGKVAAIGMDLSVEAGDIKLLLLWPCRSKAYRQR